MRCTSAGRCPFVLAGVLLAAAVLAGCPGADAPLPGPPGTFFIGTREVTVAALRDVERLHGTPVARAAAALRDSLPACERFEAHCPPEEPGCRLAERWACAGDVPALDALRTSEAAEADWLFGRALGPRGRLLARGGRSQDGSARITVDLVVPGAERGAWSLLLPDREAPGPYRLAGGRALVHARVRPRGGLDLGRFVSEDGAAARLYALRNDLFLAATLEGVYEAAIYPPAGEVSGFPRVALALDVVDAGRGRTAMEGFLSELADRWPIHREPHAVGSWAGECVANLNIMPALHPCYVVTDTSVVVGWNPGSLEIAMEPGTAPEPPGASRVSFHLARLPEVDRALQAAAGAEPTQPLAYPWPRLEVHGVAVDTGYRLTVELAAPEAAP